MIILRFDAQLFFGNIQYFKKLVFDAVGKNKGKVKGFVINARAINYIDSTATEQLIDVVKKLQQNGIRVMVVGAIGPARDLIIKSKLIKVIKKKTSLSPLVTQQIVLTGFVKKQHYKRN